MVQVVTTYNIQGGDRLLGGLSARLCVAERSPPLPSAAVHGVIHCDPSVLHEMVKALDGEVGSELAVPSSDPPHPHVSSIIARLRG